MRIAGRRTAVTQAWFSSWHVECEVSVEVLWFAILQIRAETPFLESGVDGKKDRILQIMGVTNTCQLSCLINRNLHDDFCAPFRTAGRKVRFDDVRCQVSDFHIR